MNRLLLRCFAVAAALVLAACASAPPPAAEATAAAGYGRAFGRVLYLQDGKPVEWGTSGLTNSLTLFVRPAAGGEMQYMAIAGNGEFSWPLHPGEYVIVGYQAVYRAVVTNTHTGRLWTLFSVPAAGRAAYIGDLRIESARGGYRFVLIDDFADGLQKQQSALAGFQPVKQLMRLEAEPRTYKRVAGICNEAIWGIKCDQNIRGVEPVAPEGAAQGFPVVGSLAPALEWKAAPKPGTTYDVVVYESLSFMFGMTGSVRGLRGERVAYAEGLREPRFAPPNLKPGTKYEWSVRLREGDSVSTWSTTNYSLFLVVAARSASGQGFGFATPDK
jgi:hypothetical protein